jgi:hypothetical protein
MSLLSERAKVERPPCPKCDMNMIAVSGFDLDYGGKTFECLRCGHVDLPVKRVHVV